ncbi:MAG TPA: hypothetical protein V6C85_00710 [Allocoleopsis sp.]
MNKSKSGRWDWKKNARIHRDGEIHRQENAAAFLKYTGHHRSNLLSFLLVPLCWSLFVATANALPGQTTDTVLSWITSNPTLRPGIRDGLIVKKNNSPAQRFTFQASILPPGRANTLTDRFTIRSERMTFYDQINGVTPERLRESLRAIYGPAIYQDFEQAAVVYSYPVPQSLDVARRQNRLLATAQHGELRLGERYAYWMEVTQTDTDKAFNGQLTIFLKEDVGKLEAELRDR